MIRRVTQEEDDVSLFPFLSIICAIIGVLTLMIAAVTLDQMNDENVRDAVENAIAMDRIEAELETEQAMVDELTLQIDQEQANVLSTFKDRQNELVKTRAELETLLKQLAETKQKIAEQEKVTIVIPEVPESQRETVADLRAQLKSIQDRLAVLQAELVERKRDEEARVSIVPGGSGLSYSPNFVECTAETIVLHTEDPPLTIRRAEVGSHPKFVALLERTANSRNQSIIFLLRSDSLGTYNMVKKLCEDNNVRNGKLPALGNGRIDLKNFRKK